jgi:RHS repeat-associated protein
VDGIEYSFGQITHLQGNSGQIEDGLFFYHANHLGSTQMVTDINADITQQVLYAPFGEVITEYNAYWHQEKIPDYMFNAKELDEENGMYYYEARYYAPPTFISRDPLFEEKPWISCYSYCSNNPTNRIDPDGRDDYGLDVNTGRLSLIKRTEDKMDRILLGTFGNKDDFTNNENNQIHVLSKGLLTVNNTSEDLSKTGISVSGGKQEEGIDLMKFISFNSNKELNAWGYDNNKGEAALEIAPWNENTATKSYLDNYNKSGAFDQMGTRTFKIHTHPGTKDGLGGYGYASDKDAANVQFSVPHYIMSRNHGITEYDKNNTTTPSKSMLPNSLRKHSLSK